MFPKWKKEIILNIFGTIEIPKEIKSGFDKVSYQLRYSDETIAIESDCFMRKTTPISFVHFACCKENQTLVRSLSMG